MKLHSLRLTNFRQHAATAITFAPGLTAIVGPNGAGKSSLLEAIAWSLYGQSAARGSRDSIKFSRAGPRAQVRVELEFELAGHQYRVVRGLHGAELYIDGGENAIANTITAVADALQQRLGMTRAEFFHTYFTGQKELSVFASLGPSERGHFLSRVLGFERLKVAQELMRDRRREMAAELSGLRSAMPDPDAVTRSLDETRARALETEKQLNRAIAANDAAVAQMSAIAPTWADAQTAREKHQELTGEVRIIESQLESAQRENDRITEELAGIDAARIELEALSAEIAPLALLIGEFTRLEELAREEGRRATLTESIKALADELATLSHKREKLARAPEQEEEVTIELESRRRAYDAVLRDLQSIRSDWDRDRQEAETKLKSLRDQYSELKAQREQVLNLGEDGVCPTCTRVLGSTFRTVLEQLDSQMDTITVDGRYYVTRLEQLEQMPPELRKLEDQRPELQKEVGNLERNLARVQRDVQELAQAARDIATKEQRHGQWLRELQAIPVGYDAARHEQLRRETDRLGPLNERATRLTTLLEREGALRHDSTRIAGSTAELTLRHGELTRSREGIRFSETDYARLRADQEKAAGEARAAEVALATARSERTGALRAAESAERASSDLKRAEERADALQRDKRLHDELDRAYTDLRTDLNNALRPELSELASAFLAELTDHRYSELELDDDYNIVVLEDGRPKPVISGGEEDLANLVLRLAISQMIAERAGQAFSLLVLDEIFGSLDDARRTSVVDLLHRLHDRFEQVILITHIESIAVNRRLDRVVRVEYLPETGASQVKVSGDSLPDPSGELPLLAGVGGGD
ncbi:MAG: AAA family ATPase [Gemmatimonadota bacterium]